MSFLSNIKFQYNLKILEDLLSRGDMNSFFENLEKIQSNKKIYTQLLFSVGFDAIKELDPNFFSSKISWINSFIEEDNTYLANFLSYYLYREKKEEIINTYEQNVLTELSNLQEITRINFNDFLNYSYLYQYLILKKNNSKEKFIKNNLPYFSTPNQLNFTNTILTRCYFYVLDHPYKVYQKLKKDLNDNQDLARNLFLNLDDHIETKKIDNVTIEMNKKGWHTHVNSWTSPSVLNVHRGKVILKQDLILNTFDTLSSIILHLIQSGLNVELDYNVVQSFIHDNPIPYKNIEIDISQKEKKFIDQYVEEIISNYNFDY